MRIIQPCYTSYHKFFSGLSVFSRPETYRCLHYYVHAFRDLVSLYHVCVCITFYG